MTAGKFVLAAIAAAMLFVTARADEKDFIAQAKERGVMVVNQSLPTAFAPGDVEVALTVKNAGELALRGALILETVDENGKNPRQIGKADIDMPPPSVSDAEVELSVNGRVTTAELGRTVRVILRTDKGDIVCRSATIAEKAESVKKR